MRGAQRKLRLPASKSTLAECSARPGARETQKLPELPEMPEIHPEGPISSNNMFTNTFANKFALTKIFSLCCSSLFNKAPSARCLKVSKYISERWRRMSVLVLISQKVSTFTPACQYFYIF